MENLLEPRLLVMGYGDHGKDTACKMLYALCGLTSMSSSLFSNEHIVYPVLKKRYGYESLEACYQDRHNHRAEWFELIKAYNTPDGIRLAKDLYRQFNIYNGVRNLGEFNAMKEAKLFYKSIWIDAIVRKGTVEDKKSCTVSPRDADIIIDNNGTEDDLKNNLMLALPFLFH